MISDAESDGDRLSHDECVNLVLNVIAGGVDTTQGQLSHGMLLFTRHPDQWALLAQRPQERAPAAVAEIVRFEPVAPLTARIVLEDIEYLGAPNSRRRSSSSRRGCRVSHWMARRDSAASREPTAWRHFRCAGCPTGHIQWSKEYRDC
jgi:hypothetical protein